MTQNTFNLLLILLFALLCGGLLYYLNIISRTLKKCCEKGIPTGTDTCTISYPPDSIGSTAMVNVLSNTDGATVTFSYDPNTDGGGVFPLRADLSSRNCTVKVVIRATDPNFQISAFPNQHNWFFRGESDPLDRWEFFSYGAGVADGNFNLQGSGSGVVEVYENGSNVPAKTINLQLN